MTDKPVDKTKLNPMANAFMKFFEDNYNVKFVDVTQEDEKSTKLTPQEEKLSFLPLPKKRKTGPKL